MRAAALWFSLAALAKETAILTPVALLAWALICPQMTRLARQRICLPTLVGEFPFWLRSPLLVSGMPTLLAHWICVRKPGIFPIQRAGNDGPAANSAGAWHARLAGVRILASLDVDAPDGLGHDRPASVTESANVQESVCPFSSNSRSHADLRRSDGGCRRRRPGALHADCVLC